MLLHNFQLNAHMAFLTNRLSWKRLWVKAVSYRVCMKEKSCQAHEHLSLTLTNKEDTMGSKKTLLVALLGATLIVGGCVFSQTGKLLAAPSGTNAEAARHNDEGMQAYAQGQLDQAKRHFEAAVQVAPNLAQAHYNLGMVLYKAGAEGEARPHFMKAANLAPGNSVIWSSPALSGVQTPSEWSTSSGTFSDGHGHSH